MFITSSSGHIFKNYFFIIFFACSLIFSNLFSQQLIIKGRVIDAASGEGMPFVTISFKGTTTGTTTDFDGYYVLQTAHVKDSLTASYVGYKSFSKFVKANLPSQQIDFQLQSIETKLQEVKIVFTEDPAYPIMRKVIKNKDKNSASTLSAYECEVYTKTEFDVDNISEKFKKRKIVKKITAVMDSIQRIAGENGKPILPVFISESISNYFYLKNPVKRKETILKTKVTGIGVGDGSTISQFVGSTFQQYNFYDNWLNILAKDFVSPIADSWKGFYDYYLTDSLYIDSNWCYKIDVEPKRVQDLAFSGKIWIDSKTFALVQIDVSIGKQANLNFIEKIKIQQQLAKTYLGPWLPVKTRILIDVAEITKGSPGMLAKFYTSNKNIIINNPKPVKFYENPLSINENVVEHDNNYWDQHRHDTLSSTEKNIYLMIDSVKNVPIVKTYVEVANIIANGYKKFGGLEIGPYALLVANNNIEGFRPRLGFKTNGDFSKNWIFRGYLAYGFGDKEFKYDAQAHYILNRDHWSMIGYKFRHELEQVGRLTEDLYDNTLFLASTKWGTVRRGFIRNDHQLYFQTDLTHGIRQTFKARHHDFNPLANSFTFAFIEDKNDVPNSIRRNYITSELIGETRISNGETFVISDNDRYSLGTKKIPVFTLTYIFGFKGIGSSDFDYIKLGFNAYQELRLGTLGRGYFNLDAWYTPSTLPYPLLFVHRGNQSYFYNSLTYNLMNYFEFVSDTYTSLKYEQHFEGLLFNRLPLIKKLKWRFVANTNILYGSVRQENFDIIPATVDNLPVDKFTSLGNVPYVEIGYGIENIFKFVRLDFLHRATYRDSPGATNIGVKVSTQFKF